MKLFNVAPIKRYKCRSCIYFLRGANQFSDKYTYCTRFKCNRTSTGFKKAKPMDCSCSKFKQK